MGNKIGQLEIPSSPSRKRSYKKQRIRKIRQWTKRNNDFCPKFNCYTGYS